MINPTSRISPPYTCRSPSPVSLASAMASATRAADDESWPSPYLDQVLQVRIQRCFPPSHNFQFTFGKNQPAEAMSSRTRRVPHPSPSHHYPVHTWPASARALLVKQSPTGARRVPPTRCQSGGPGVRSAPAASLGRGHRAVRSRGKQDRGFDLEVRILSALVIGPGGWLGTQT